MFCIHCGRPLRKRKQVDGVPPWHDTHTIDHIFPRRMIRHEKRSPAWHRINEQASCPPCNGTKGSMHPLKWMSIMPSAAGAYRLAALLVELGVPKRRVEKWLARRADADPA